MHTAVLIQQGSSGSEPFSYRDGTPLTTSFAYDALAQGRSRLTRGRTHDYGYDDLDHLASANHPTKQVDEAFAHDTVGNRENPADAAVYDYNANHQIISGPGNITYLFDDDGNLASKTGGAATETFTHNEDSRLMQYANGSTTATYQYDPFGCIRDWLEDEGHQVNRKRVQRLMQAKVGCGQWMVYHFQARQARSSRSRDAA